jgi:hypothetical protein
MFEGFSCTRNLSSCGATAQPVAKDRLLRQHISECCKAGIADRLLLREQMILQQLVPCDVT